MLIAFRDVECSMLPCKIDDEDILCAGQEWALHRGDNPKYQSLTAGIGIFQDWAWEYYVIRARMDIFQDWVRVYSVNGREIRYQAKRSYITADFRVSRLNGHIS